MPRYMLNTDTCWYIMKRSSQAVLTRLLAVPGLGRLHVGHHGNRELLSGGEDVAAPNAGPHGAAGVPSVPGGYQVFAMMPRHTTPQKSAPT